MLLNVCHPPELLRWPTRDSPLSFSWHFFAKKADFADAKLGQERSANQERLSDCLDDQVVIEEIKLCIAQEFTAGSSQHENRPWGGIFRHGCAQENVNRKQVKADRRPHRKLQRTLTRREDNAE